MRGRALAVGTCYMDSVITVLRFAQQRTKLLNTLQPRLIGISSHLLERGHLIKEGIYRLFVGHTR